MLGNMKQATKNLRGVHKSKKWQDLYSLNRESEFKTQKTKTHGLICLLNVLTKLFEQLILIRLKISIKRCGHPALE